MAHRKGKFPFVTYYLHCILRLTPTYMFVLFLFWFLTVHLGHGPQFLVSTDLDSAMVKVIGGLIFSTSAISTKHNI